MSSQELHLPLRYWLTAAAAFAGAYVVLTIVKGALSAFILLFCGTLFAAGLRPFVDRLSVRMPRATAVALTFGAVLLIAVLLVCFLTAPLLGELNRFCRTAPSLLHAFQDRLIEVQRFIRSHELAQRFATIATESAGGALSALASDLTRGSALIGSIAADAVLVMLLAIGWIFASKELSTFLLSLLPRAASRNWQGAFDSIDDRLSAYVQGVVLNGTIVGVVMAGALGLLGIPYALLLGLIAAVFQAIPMIGAVISGAILVLAALASGGWSKMLIVLAVFVIVQIVDQNIVSPVIFGNRVKLSFLLIVLSTVIGGTLLGIGGAFLAVPAAAILEVILVQIIAPAVRRANQE